MGFTDEVLQSLKGLASVSKVSREGLLAVGMAMIYDTDLEEVEQRIEAVLEPHLPRGEKIVSPLKTGKIIDSGTGHFKILGGYVVEFYEYEKGASVFIRNYLISDGAKEWIAVYVDENPRSLWWDRDEGHKD